MRVTKFFRSIPFLILITVGLGLFVQPSTAADYSCLESPQPLNEEPTWSTSSSKDLRFVASWTFQDPEKCIVGMDDFYSTLNNFHYQSTAPDIRFPTVWTLSRAGEKVLISAEAEFPIPLLQSLPNRNLDGFGYWSPENTKYLNVSGNLKIRKGSGFAGDIVDGKYYLSHLWGNWFSKNQGLVSNDCSRLPPPELPYMLPDLDSKVTWKVLSPGPKPKIEITIKEDSNCIFLVHSGPLEKPLKLNKFAKDTVQSLAEVPFWDGEAPPYFNQIIGKSDQIVSVGVGDFTGTNCCSINTSRTDVTVVKNLPEKVLTHSDVVTREGEGVKVITTLEASQLSPSSTGIITIYVGYYWWYDEAASSSPSGWRVTFSGNNWTARYSKGFSQPAGPAMAYTTRAIKIPIQDLFRTEADKAAADKAAADKAAADKAAQRSNSTANRVVSAKIFPSDKSWAAWIKSFDYVSGPNPLVAKKPTKVKISGGCTSSGKAIQVMKNRSDSGAKYPNGMRYIKPVLVCKAGIFSGVLNITGETKISITELPASHVGTEILFRLNQELRYTEID